MNKKQSINWVQLFAGLMIAATGNLMLTVFGLSILWLVIFSWVVSFCDITDAVWHWISCLRKTKR